MKPNLRGILIYSWIVAFPVLGFSQKVRVGYDKGTDFLKFRSYTWAAPTMPTTRPLLFESIVGWVDNGLKGLSCQANNIGSLVGRHKSCESQETDWR
jgi:hypothetical protein